HLRLAGSGGGALDRGILRSPSPRELRPLPDTARDFSRESVSKLPHDHAELASGVPLVGGEVTQEMMEIRGKVLPGLPWHTTAVRQAQVHEPDHSFAAAGQRPGELVRSDSAQVDAPRGLDAVAGAETLDPDAAAVVDVRGDHSNRQPGDAEDPAPPNGR